MTRGRRIRSIAGWGLQALLAFAFVSIGLGKFGDPSGARSFVRWGYPEGFHLVVGAIEMTGGVLLLVVLAISTLLALLFAGQVWLDYPVRARAGVVAAGAGDLGHRLVPVGGAHAGDLVAEPARADSARRDRPAGSWCTWSPRF